MRFHYSNLSRPKAAAKAIAKAIDGLSLSQAQNGLAIALGYSGWHEFEQAHAAQDPTVLDQRLPELEAPVRIADIAIRLADALDLYYGDAGYVIAKSHATGDLELDEWLTTSIADSLDGTQPRPRSQHSRFRFFTAAELAESTRPWKGGERRAEPSRLSGQIPFPPDAAEWLDALIAKYERDEELQVLHAHYRDYEDTIRVTLRFAIIMHGELVETEHDSGFLFKKDDLTWDPDGGIAQRARLPGFRARRVLDGLKRSA